MLPNASEVRGVHPGLILERELRFRKLKKSRFALDIGEYPQVLTAITKMRRGITPSLSVRLGRVFGCDTDLFMVLQAQFDVLQAEKRLDSERKRTPDLTVLRSALFWDTDIDRIDWEKNRNAVIERVFSRGNAMEKAEIASFYRIPTAGLEV